MGFLGLGHMEVLAILVVALIALGPGRLPDIARNLGRTVSALKKASQDATTEVTRELQVLDREDRE
jgi:sec-independent protein translocase protein TatB